MSSISKELSAISGILAILKKAQWAAKIVFNHMLNRVQTNTTFPKELVYHCTLASTPRGRSSKFSQVLKR